MGFGTEVPTIFAALAASTVCGRFLLSEDDIPLLFGLWLTCAVGQEEQVGR